MNQELKDFLAKFGAEDCREGSRSVGHDGIDTGDWEDYAEIPIETLERMRAILARILGAPREPGEMGAGVHFRSAVEAMVRMLEEGEWAEHVAATTGNGDPLAQRLEDAIADLINEANDGRELAGSGDVDGANRAGASSVGVAGVETPRARTMPGSAGGASFGLGEQSLS